MIVRRFVIAFFLLPLAVLLLWGADTVANQGRITMGFFESVFSDKSLQPKALADIKPKRHNSYLAADAEQTSAKANTSALRFASSVEDVSDAIRSIMLDDLSAEERSGDGVLLFIDRTPLLRYPDGLYAWLDEVDGQTRVALFSRSVYGRRDFGVNAKRVQYLVQELNKRFAG